VIFGDTEPQSQPEDYAEHYTPADRSQMTAIREHEYNTGDQVYSPRKAVGNVFPARSIRGKPADCPRKYLRNIAGRPEDGEIAPPDTPWTPGDDVRTLFRYRSTVRSEAHARHSEPIRPTIAAKNGWGRDTSARRYAKKVRLALALAGGFLASIAETDVKPSHTVARHG
jgi:hypothetical protein